MMAVNTYTCVAEFTQYAAIDALRDREGNTPRHGRRVCAPPRTVCARPESRAGFPLPSPRRRVLRLGRHHRHRHAAPKNLCRILLEDAGVAAIPGAAFGPSGKDFIRFSFASSMATLQEAVERIVKVSSLAGNTVRECSAPRAAIILRETATQIQVCIRSRLWLLGGAALQRCDELL